MVIFLCEWVIDMDAGEVHMISGWPNDESDDEDDD